MLHNGTKQGVERGGRRTTIPPADGRVLLLLRNSLVHTLHKRHTQLQHRVALLFRTTELEVRTSARFEGDNYTQKRVPACPYG